MKGARAGTNFGRDKRLTRYSDKQFWNKGRTKVTHVPDAKIMEVDKKERLVGLKGSLDMANVAIEAIGDIQMSIKNRPQLINSYVWLCTMRDNLTNEIKTLEPEPSDKPAKAHLAAEANEAS